VFTFDNEFGHDAKEKLESRVRKFAARENGTVVIEVMCAVPYTFVVFNDHSFLTPKPLGFTPRSTFSVSCGRANIRVGRMADRVCSESDHLPVMECCGY
jgi:hypothetical protein